ncbi:MAG: branched-chain amino acid ABC transporter permease [Acidimicrobiia bacterium]
MSLLFAGISLGSIYALIALGFAIVYKATRIVNFAQAGFILLGAYVVSLMAASYDWNYWLALFAGCCLLVCVAIVSERFLVRPIRHQPLIVVVIMTIAIDLLIRTDVTRRIGVGILPTGDPWGTATLVLGPITVPAARLVAMAVVLVVMTTFFVWFKYSVWGVALRAASENAVTAGHMGIGLGAVSAITWGIAGALGALGGAFLVLVPSPGVEAGVANTALRALPAVVLGGMDSTGGAVAGAVVIGVAEAFAQGYATDIRFLGRGFSGVIAYVVMIGVLLIRPSGLFGSVEVSRL